MKTPNRRRPKQRGVTFIEILIAGLLLSIGLMGLVNVWNFSFQITTNTDDKVVAYNLGRQAMERMKLAGFNNTPPGTTTGLYPDATEGTTTLYYNGNLGALGSASGARFSVTTSVTSSAVKSGTAGVAGAVPSDTALRTVTVTVKLISTNQTLYQASTYLVRAGI